MGEVLSVDEQVEQAINQFNELEIDSIFKMKDMIEEMRTAFGGQFHSWFRVAFVKTCLSFVVMVTVKPENVTAFYRKLSPIHFANEFTERFHQISRNIRLKIQAPMEPSLSESPVNDEGFQGLPDVKVAAGEWKEICETFQSLKEKNSQLMQERNEAFDEVTALKTDNLRLNSAIRDLKLKAAAKTPSPVVADTSWLKAYKEV